MGKKLKRSEWDRLTGFALSLLSVDWCWCDLHLQDICKHCKLALGLKQQSSRQLKHISIIWHHLYLYHWNTCVNIVEYNQKNFLSFQKLLDFRYHINNFDFVIYLLHKSADQIKMHVQYMPTNIRCTYILWVKFIQHKFHKESGKENRHLQAISGSFRAASICVWCFSFVI